MRQDLNSSLPSEWHWGEYSITNDPGRLDIASIFDFLTNSSYWAQGVTRDVVERSIQNSLNFGVFHSDQQVGFARVVTDYATFALLADVFIAEEHRQKGLGKWLVQVVTSHPHLQGLRRWILATRDAHELYKRVGFQELYDPARWMERRGDKKPNELN